MAKGKFPCDAHPDSTATPKGRCRACNREYQNRWYHQNAELHGSRTRKNTVAARERAREFVWDHLTSNPCVDCGESDPIVLEFDHVRDIKSHGLTHMISRGWGVETIKAEIAKCEVRCANCHVRRTTIQLGWWKGKHTHRESSG